MKAFEARECYKNCKICKHQDLSLNTPGMEKCAASGKRVAFPFFCETEKSEWVVLKGNEPTKNIMAWVTLKGSELALLASYSHSNHGHLWYQFGTPFPITGEIVAYAPITIPDVYKEINGGIQ